MDKKTIVIVGAGKGMGNHVAKKFGENDFRIVLMARNRESLASYIKEFEGEGIECHGITADAADTDSLTEAFMSAQKMFGKIDVMVYNAAILEAGYPTTLTSEDLMHHYQVDVASALHCTKQVLPAQLEGGVGTIIFTGGGLATYPMAEFTCVSMGKAALRGLAFTLNQELNAKNIFVGIVTIMGNISSNTHYDPKLIAEDYWKLYAERKGCEIIYK